MNVITRHSVLSFISATPGHGGERGGRVALGGRRSSSAAQLSAYDREIERRADCFGLVRRFLFFPSFRGSLAFDFSMFMIFLWVSNCRSGGRCSLGRVLVKPSRDWGLSVGLFSHRRLCFVSFLCILFLENYTKTRKYLRDSPNLCETCKPVEFAGFLSNNGNSSISPVFAQRNSIVPCNN